eukprot:SAG22_NODE_310_length_12645_cov_20.450183_8_plen_200_part_00
MAVAEFGSWRSVTDGTVRREQPAFSRPAVLISLAQQPAGGKPDQPVFVVDIGTPSSRQSWGSDAWLDRGVVGPVGLWEFRPHAAEMLLLASAAGAGQWAPPSSAAAADGDTAVWKRRDDVGRPGRPQSNYSTAPAAWRALESSDGAGQTPLGVVGGGGGGAAGCLLVREAVRAVAFTDDEQTQQKPMVVSLWECCVKSL